MVPSDSQFQVVSASGIACLPMYDWPEIRASITILWEEIAHRLADCGFTPPAHLHRQENLLEMWQSPNLLLGQTCTGPYRKYLRDKVNVLGGLSYGEWAPEGYYNSIVCVSEAHSTRGNHHGLKLAVNSCESYSGYECLESLVPEHIPMSEFFSERIVTGSHRASLHKVAKGTADIAAIDSVAWGLAERYEPRLVSDVKVITKTRLTPGCPLITSKTHSARESELIRESIKGTLKELPEEHHYKLAGGHELGWVNFTENDYTAKPLKRSAGHGL